MGQPRNKDNINKTMEGGEWCCADVEGIYSIVIYIDVSPVRTDLYGFSFT